MNATHPTPLKIKKPYVKRIVGIGVEKKISLPEIRKLNWVSRSFQNFSFYCDAVTITDFSNADLHNSTWFNYVSDDPEQRVQKGVYFGKCKFDNANMVGLKGEDIMFDTCSFRQTNLAKVNFNNFSFIGKTDFSGSNITQKQFETIRYKQNMIYKRVSFRETREILKMDMPDFKNWLATQADVRDNKTKEKVMGNFSPRTHHIPQWVIQQELKRTIR